MKTNYEVTERAYAKINLYLDVLNRRSDGYHDILSVMQTVSLYDTVKLRLTEGDTEMSCSDKTLSCGEDNLCIRAARKYLEAIGSRVGAYIYLEKIIPREAGLGGGSADAAAVLRGLNSLFDNRLDTASLCKLGKEIGADVPFCIVGGTYIVGGIGEALEKAPELLPCSVVISGGYGKVSTRVAYEMIDSSLPTTKADFSGFKTALERGDLGMLCDKLYNRFEDVVPSSRRVKELFRSCSADGTLMSGSGSAVFGIFRDAEKAKNACKTLEREGLSAFLCEPVCGI